MNMRSLCDFTSLSAPFHRPESRHITYFPLPRERGVAGGRSDVYKFKVRQGTITLQSVVNYTRRQLNSECTIHVWNAHYTSMRTSTEIPSRASRMRRDRQLFISRLDRNTQRTTLTTANLGERSSQWGTINCHNGCSKP